MAKEVTYEEIVRNLRNKVYAPVYFLMGEEDYYIDRISDYIIDTVLTDTEKEFNLTVLYGSDRYRHDYQCREALSDDVEISSGGGKRGAGDP